MPCLYFLYRSFVCKSCRIKAAWEASLLAEPVDLYALDRLDVYGMGTSRSTNINHFMK